MSKFKILKENICSGENCEIITSNIIRQLEIWDASFGLEISAVENNRLLVLFKTLPDELDELANEIYKICPDIIDQHFGCMDEMVEMMEESDQDIDPELAQLIDGIDFEKEDFGMDLLIKSLATTKQLSLWWD